MQRILIVTKYRFIGDTLLAVPTIRATAQAWPDAAITLLTGARAHELMQNCPYITDVVEFDPYRSSDQGLSRYFELIHKLGSHKFDAALVLNRSFHSALTCFLGGARLRAGWAGFHGRDFLLQRRCEYRSDVSEIDCYYDVLRSACDDTPPVAEFDRNLELWLTQEEINVPPHPVFARPRIVGIQPGATHAYKRWPSERFAQLCCEMISQGMANHIVLLGGPDEIVQAEETMRQISTSVRTKLTNLVGQLSLRQTLSALTRLQLFVGNDTAIRHAAVALDTPSLALFGPTSAAKWGNAMSPRHIVLEAPSQSIEDIAMTDALGGAGQILRQSCPVGETNTVSIG